MFADTTILVLAAILTWLMLITASALRTRVLQKGGAKRAVGPRDDLGEPSVIGARADRAARNMLENFVLFVALIVAVHFTGKVNAQVQLGANIFFWSRLAYWPAYLVHMPWVRSVVWIVSIVGLAMIAAAIV